MGKMVQLVRFLMHLTNEAIQLELKDGCIIQGTIVGVDVLMNTHLRGVKMVSLRNKPIIIDKMTVRGSSLRHFVLPDSINIDTLLVDIDIPLKIQNSRGLSRVGKKGRTLNRNRTRGRNRTT